jgi:histidinol-phosphatase (PHP family)
VKEVWAGYVDRLTEAAQSGLFDILGHIDLPKKFGHYPDASVLPRYERFLQAARAAGVAIELNTAGLRKDCREIYPSRAILEAAFRCSVPITFGSDAHAPEEVGSAWAEALALARSVGYQTSCRFAARQRSEVQLDLVPPGADG